MLPFTKRELVKFGKLNTPAKVQDFLNTIPINHEPGGKDTVKSPVMVMRTKSAHCIEGALLAAYILSFHGYKPLILHLESTREDMDHVIAVFRDNGLWGAISKTNHAVLRYREPVYKSIRELVMSYFHEYFTNDGVKTLRRYSEPMNLNEFGPDWMYEEKDLWGIDEALDKIKHYDIAPKETLKTLRRADKIERGAGQIVEWEE